MNGYIEAYSTYCCNFWFSEEGIRLELPFSALATHMWWLLAPEVNGRDILRGPVFVTGLPDEASDSLPVPDDVVDLLQRIDAFQREQEGSK